MIAKLYGLLYFGLELTSEELRTRPSIFCFHTGRLVKKEKGGSRWAATTTYHRKIVWNEHTKKREESSRFFDSARVQGRVKRARKHKVPFRRDGLERPIGGETDSTSPWSCSSGCCVIPLWDVYFINFSYVSLSMNCLSASFFFVKKSTPPPCNYGL